MILSLNILQLIGHYLINVTKIFKLYDYVSQIKPVGYDTIFHGKSHTEIN